MKTNRQTGLESNSLSRNYGVDLLRIVSMMMIVVLHVLSHGGIINAVDPKSVGFWSAYFLEMAVFGAVNIYAIISGYVSVFSKYKFSNLIVLWCQVAFYSVLITLVCKYGFHKAIGTKDLICAFLPVLSNQYWYFTAYFILFLFIPLLNAALLNIPQRKMAVILLGLIIVVSVMNPLSSLLAHDAFALAEGYSAWWLMVLYLIGGYIRRYGLFPSVKSPVLLLLYLASVTATWASKWIIGSVTESLFGGSKASGLMCSYLSVTILASAIFLFLLFERVHPKKAWVRLISFLSPLAFSVYLIHDNNHVRAFLMKDQFAWIAPLPWYEMIPLILIMAFGIYIVCSCVDLIRHYLFGWIKLKEKLAKYENRLKAKYYANKVR